jgi:glutamate dehydrogenase (NAD(P)+)
VGSAAARLFAEKKARIVAISDTRGGVANPRGIDPMKAIRYKERSGTVVGMPGASRISNDDLLTLKCDILVPAALEGVLTLHNADQVKARIVAEAANGPTTPHADEVLVRRGITILPDILANAGGVAVSYFEWVQNQQGLIWDAEEVDARLQKTMTRAFTEMVETMRKHHVPPRAGAMILAVGRVAEATLVRGLFP